jgi:hypothetical protein
MIVLLRVLFVLHFIHFLRSILIKLLQNMCSLSYRLKKALDYIAEPVSTT